MSRRHGGTAARNGFYWHLAKWEMTVVPKQGGILPGDAGDRYLRVPVVGVLVLAPLMGAVFALFLPFIGFAMLFVFLGRKAAALVVGVGAMVLQGQRSRETPPASREEPRADTRDLQGTDAASGRTAGEGRGAADALPGAYPREDAGGHGGGERDPVSPTPSAARTRADARDGAARR